MNGSPKAMAVFSGTGLLIHRLEHSCYEGYLGRSKMQEMPQNRLDARSALLRHDQEYGLTSRGTEKYPGVC